MKAIFKFFDVLEDKVRAWLSKRPILYGVVASIGAVLYFRALWDFADMLHIGVLFGFVLSFVVLLITGSFVAHFVSNEVILSGLKKEKKLIEKTEGEVASEAVTLAHIKDELKIIQKEMAEIKQKLG